MLIIHIPKRVSFHLKVVGDVSLNSGFWVYIGSAMGLGSTNLENRIQRHFRSQKKIHWHIDYLLSTDAQLKAAVWAESPDSFECIIAQQLAMNKDFIAGPNGFGSSDCESGCTTHLYYAMNGDYVEKTIMDTFQALNLTPRVTYDGMIKNCT